MAEDTKHPFEGFVIACAGRLSRSRREIAEIVTANGGKFSKNVTKKVTHVIAADPDAPSDGLVKARKYEAEIVGESILDGLSSEGCDHRDAPPKVLLADKWDSGMDCVGWWCSEKFDGVRAWWDGRSFRSRQGNPFQAPEWFIEQMPKDHHLDGELYLGRGMFNDTISIVRASQGKTDWTPIRFMVFDTPSSGHLPFEDRLALLRDICEPIEVARVVDHHQIGPDDDLEAMLEEIESQGAEGLMLRQPQSKYEGKRSNTLLKVKSFKDDEAQVLGWEFGAKGRLRGKVKSLKVLARDGTEFKVGSGLTDELRENPPPIGSLITYRYQELTKAGVPRFPTYIGPAIDKDFP